MIILSGAEGCVDSKLLHLALVAQSVLVKQVLRHLVVVGVHAGEVGDVVSQLLDGLHLLIQVMGLQEVAHLVRNGNERTKNQDSCGLDVKSSYLSFGRKRTYVRVSVLGGQLVKVQQSLVDVLLQLQSALHGLQSTAPLITFRFLLEKKKKKHFIIAAIY